MVSPSPIRDAATDFIRRQHEDDTIDIYYTDNGPHLNTRPDSVMTAFRNEKSLSRSSQG